MQEKKSYSEELSRSKPELLAGGTFYYAQICPWNSWPCLLLVLRCKWESVGLSMHDWWKRRKKRKKKKSQVKEDINSHDTMCESISKDWLFPWRYFRISWNFSKGVEWLISNCPVFEQDNLQLWTVFCTIIVSWYCELMSSLTTREQSIKIHSVSGRSFLWKGSSHRRLTNSAYLSCVLPFLSVL